MKSSRRGVPAWLAFWAKNVTLLRDAGMNWPGFSYDDAQWVTLRLLADAVPVGRFGRFLTITTVAFIALAAVGIVCVFLPLATLFFPVPAQTRPLPFVLLLAATALLIIGIGIPVAMRIAAAASVDATTRTRLAEMPGDAALQRTVGFQLSRMTAIMCGIFVPGALLWIAFNVQAGPVITTLKWAAILAMAASLTYSVRAKPAS